MDKKWLPLTVVLGAAAVAVVTASAWPPSPRAEPPFVPGHRRWPFHGR